MSDSLSRKYGRTPCLLFWLRRARKLGSLVFVFFRKHVRFIRKYFLVQGGIVYPVNTRKLHVC